MKIHYFNSNPKTLGFNNDFYKTLFGHTINEKNNDVFIKPIKFNKVSLSPSNILGLKKTYNIKEIQNAMIEIDINHKLREMLIKKGQK